MQVRFHNFENYNKKNIPESKKPYIEIEDDGSGMTIETIQKVWLRPATPNKFNNKKGKLRFTKKSLDARGERHRKICNS
ncbi:MAG: ATP-binding protein [Bacteroidetes bacterium]|nr:ATP-binding protein [Bacteroidota bacterium]